MVVIDREDVAAPTARRTVTRSRTAVLSYLAAVGVTMTLVLLWMAPWSHDMRGIFPEGGDLAWVQATVQAHADAGPVGTSSHIAWPDGYAPWSVPQLGMGVAIAAWVLGDLLGFGSAAGVWLIVLAVAAACAAASLYFFRALVGDALPILTVTAACSLGASPFVIDKVGHLSVAAFFVIPLAMGACLQTAAGRRRIGTVGLVVGAAVLSPLWWVIVVLMAVGVTLAPALVRRERDAVTGRLLVIAALGVGFVVQTVLYQVSQVEGAPATRSAWDSNAFGGHLTDLLMSSPYLNPRLFTDLSAGASSELSPVGLVPGLAAIGVVVLLVLGISRGAAGHRESALLADLTVAGVLLFLAGGLGNLQAAVAVLGGGSSPARVWSRLTILLALVGYGWLLHLAASGRLGSLAVDPRRVRLVSVLSLGIATAVAATWVADVRQTPAVGPVSPTELPEYGAVNFLRGAVDPCPVAQLPRDGFPVVRVFDGTAVEIRDFYYRGFFPYLMAPDFSWSFASWVPGKAGGLSEIPVEAGPAALETLRSQGFCAVMYDKQLASTAEGRSIPLEGRDLRGLDAPDFASERYDVHLLG